MISILLAVLLLIPAMQVAEVRFSVKGFASRGFPRKKGFANSRKGVAPCVAASVFLGSHRVAQHLDSGF